MSEVKRYHVRVRMHGLAIADPEMYGEYFVLASDYDSLKADRDHWQSRCAALHAALAKMLARGHMDWCTYVWRLQPCTCGADEARKLLEPAHMTSTRHE